MSLLLLTLASDPYDRPGHWMPWRRRCGAAEDLQQSWLPGYRGGASGDIRQCPATVKLRLTSEKPQVRTLLRPPDNPS